MLKIEDRKAFESINVNGAEDRINGQGRRGGGGGGGGAKDKT